MFARLLLLFALVNSCIGHEREHEHKHKHDTRDVARNSTLHFRDEEVSSDIDVYGNIDIEGSMILSCGSITMTPGSSFSNSGVLILKNNSKVVVTRNTVFNLNNNIISKSNDTSVVIDGQLNINPNTTIEVTAPIFVNYSAQLVVDSFASLTVSDVVYQGDLQINPNATLIVSPNSTVLVDSVTSRRKRRLLQQVSTPGTCLFNQAILTGSGLLDCNVVFSGVIDGSQYPSVLEVSSLSIDSLSTTIMSYSNMIVSKNDIKIDGELVVDLTGVSSSANFTILFSDYGTISGTFSKQTIIGTNKPYSVVYTPNSVEVVTAPSTISFGPPILRTNVIVPIIVCSILATFLVFAVIRFKRQQQQPVYDVEYAYVNPLMK
jgi:hypothetical protein